MDIISSCSTGGGVNFLRLLPFLILSWVILEDEATASRWCRLAAVLETSNLSARVQKWLTWLYQILNILEGVALEYI